MRLGSAEVAVFVADGPLLRVRPADDGDKGVVVITRHEAVGLKRRDFAELVAQLSSMLARIEDAGT